MCKHAPSGNPRHDHGTHFSCVKCSRLVPKPDNGDRVRDVEDERLLTRIYCENPEALTAFAEARANPGPVDNLLLRDFPQDAAEELADCRSYLVWGIQQLDEHDVDEAMRAEIRMFYAMALQSVGEAFTAVSKAAALWQQEIAPRRGKSQPNAVAHAA